MTQEDIQCQSLDPYTSTHVCPPVLIHIHENLHLYTHTENRVSLLFFFSLDKNVPHTERTVWFLTNFWKGLSYVLIPLTIRYELSSQISNE